MSATNNRAPIRQGVYPKRWGNCRLTAHLHSKQQRQKLSQWAFLTSHLLLKTDVSRMSCYRARCPQGGTVSSRWRWPLSANPVMWLWMGNGEGQHTGTLFLKGSAILSTAPPFLQDLQPFQTCPRDLSTASLYNNFLLSAFWGYKLLLRTEL